MNYAKMINNQPSYAPNPIHVGRTWWCNPPGEVYEGEGYKPVTFTEQPEAPEGYYYAEVWSETDESIVQGWELHELPPDEEIGADEALDILFGGDNNG